MDKSYRATGLTVEEALEAALGDLGLRRDQVRVEVLDEGARGFWGLGQRDAVVEVTYKPPKKELAQAFGQELLGLMGFEGEVEVEEDDLYIHLSFDSEAAGALIGRRGQTINAIQHVSNLILGRQSDDARRIVVDVAGYRRKRQRSLEGLAIRMAARARRGGRPVRMEPMPSHERKTVHMALKNVPEITTRSEGKDPFRRVVITPEK